MNKIYSLLFISFIWLNATAQKEHNVWYFGYTAGLDFNSGSPVALTNSAMTTDEGCSSICDASGNLLFYTDGSTLWNKNHVAMPNGTGLMGNSTSTQSGLIVKQPGNTNLYYVFSTFSTGLYYSVVDITLNGGLGDVNGSKNVYVYIASEKQSATKHANGTDVWLLSHESSTNGFNAFLLTSAGLNLTPVHSNVGLVDVYLYGYLKISPTGKQVALGIFNPGPDTTVTVADFDNSTGIVSGGFNIPGTTTQCYGLGFSPDGTKLYCGANPNNNIFQYDLTAGTPAAIIASAVMIGNTGSNATGCMQIGPDNKLYIAPQASGYVDVINSPNSAGLACNFVHNAVYLSGETCQLGLPNAVDGGAAVVLPPIALFQASDTSFCEENCINYTDKSTNATSWQWSFQGAAPPTSTDQNPQNICYFTNGSFNATLIVSNSGGTDTLTLVNYIKVNPTPPTPNITQSNDTLYCSFDSSYKSYQWYANSSLAPNATNSYFIASGSGNYNVSVTNSAGCSIAVGIVLGLNNIYSIYDLYLTPNPAKDELILNSSLQSGDAIIIIYNALGEKLYEERTILKNSIPLNIKDLATGVYFVQLIKENSDGMQWVGRFIKE